MAVGRTFLYFFDGGMLYERLGVPKVLCALRFRRILLISRSAVFRESFGSRRCSTLTALCRGLGLGQRAASATRPDRPESGDGARAPAGARNRR